MADPKFKKSADFSITVGYEPSPGQPANLIGYTPESYLEDGAGILHKLDCTMAEDGMSVVIIASAEQTNQWRCGSASIDVRFTLGTSVLTDTLTFPIVKNITPLST